MSDDGAHALPARPRIAFFDVLEVFDDFYPSYGISRAAFATEFAATSNHAFAHALQMHVGDVTWYEGVTDPPPPPVRHRLGFIVELVRTPTAHRALRAIADPLVRAGGARRASSRTGTRRAVRMLRGVWAPLRAVQGYLSIASPSLWTRFRREPPDLFFVQDYANGRFDLIVFAARLLSRPVVAYHTGIAPERQVGRLLRGIALRRTDLLIASGRAERDVLVHRYRVAPERVTIVHQPVDVDVFRPRDREESCARLGLDPRRRHLLWIGRIETRKRVAALVDAFLTAVGERQDVTLLVAGDGPGAGELRAELARRREHRVALLGWIHDDETKAALFNVSELSAVVSEWEGLPNVVGESLACGTPVLAARVGGIEDIVRPGATGWLVDERLDDLDAVLRSIVESPPPASMRANARRDAEERLSDAAVGIALARAVGGLLSRRA